VPCYVGWKGKITPHAIDVPLAHIDVTPTLVDLCQVNTDDVNPGWDGRGFRRLLLNEPGPWPDRTLFVQWHRGDVPERGRAFAARGPRYKLVQAAGAWADAKAKPKYELFDIPNDPFEEKDLAAEKPDVVAKLTKEYDAWFDDVTKKGFEPPRIIIGNEKENPVRLSRQDWRGPKAGWTPDSEGYWEVKIERAGKYEFGMGATPPVGTYYLKVGDVGVEAEAAEGTRGAAGPIDLPAGNARVQAWIGEGKERRGVNYVRLKYLGPPDRK
jgi:hypothetical protein